LPSFRNFPAIDLNSRRSRFGGTGGLRPRPLRPRSSRIFFGSIKSAKFNMAAKKAFFAVSPWIRPCLFKYKLGTLLPHPSCFFRVVGGMTDGSLVMVCICKVLCSHCTGGGKVIRSWSCSLPDPRQRCASSVLVIAGRAGPGRNPSRRIARPRAFRCGFGRPEKIHSSPTACTIKNCRTPWSSFSK